MSLRGSAIEGPGCGQRWGIRVGSGKRISPNNTAAKLDRATGSALQQARAQSQHMIHVPNQDSYKALLYGLALSQLLIHDIIILLAMCTRHGDFRHIKLEGQPSASFDTTNLKGSWGLHVPGPVPAYRYRKWQKCRYLIV